MTDPRIAAVSDAMIAAADRLRAGHRCVSAHLALAGHVIEVAAPRHVNASGIAIEDAFITPGRATGEPESMESAAGEPIRLTVIDDAVAGRPPAFDWPAEWNEPFGMVREEYALPRRFAMDVHSRSFSVWDPAAREAVVWFREVEHIPWWAAATPFRLHLSWIGDSLDAEMIHGAAVVVDDRAVLIIGPSGAGKSTLALAAVRAGLTILGDDYLLLADDHAQAVYRRAKAHDETLAALGPIPGTRVLSPQWPGSKRILDLDRGVMDGRLLPISAVIAPTFGPEPGMRPLGAAQIARRLVVPSMEGLLGGTSGTLGRMARLLREVPTAELVIGPDPQANVEALVDAARSLTRVGVR